MSDELYDYFGGNASKKVEPIEDDEFDDETEDEVVSEEVVEIGDEPAQQYWGPLIGTVIQKLIIPFGNSTLFLHANNEKMSVLITKPNQKVMHNNLMIFFQHFSILWTF